MQGEVGTNVTSEGCFQHPFVKIEISEKVSGFCHSVLRSSVISGGFRDCWARSFFNFFFSKLVMPEDLALYFPN